MRWGRAILPILSISMPYIVMSKNADKASSPPFFNWIETLFNSEEIYG